MLNRDFDAASRSWLEAAGIAYDDLRRSFDLGNQWTFNIEKLQHRATGDLDPDQLDGLRGSTAFMLRRMQAINFLLRHDDPLRYGLLLGHCSDLLTFLILLRETGATQVNESSVESLTVATGDLLVQIGLSTDPVAATF